VAELQTIYHQRAKLNSYLGFWQCMSKSQPCRYATAFDAGIESATLSHLNRRPLKYRP